MKSQTQQVVFLLFTLIRKNLCLIQNQENISCGKKYGVKQWFCTYLPCICGTHLVHFPLLKKPKAYLGYSLPTCLVLSIRWLEIRTVVPPWLSGRHHYLVTGRGHTLPPFSRNAGYLIMKFLQFSLTLQGVLIDFSPCCLETKVI